MVATFRTTRAAKDYLADRIAEEAVRQGSPLTEIEQKMLYFTQSGGRQTEMMLLNSEFERDYNEVEYESRIGGLVHAIYMREDRASEHDRESWNDAVASLTDEEDYLLILIDAAQKGADPAPLSVRRFGPWMPVFSRRGPREPGDLVRLVLVGLGLGGLMLSVMVVLALLR